MRVVADDVLSGQPTEGRFEGVHQEDIVLEVLLISCSDHLHADDRVEILSSQIQLPEDFVQL